MAGKADFMAMEQTLRQHLMPHCRRLMAENLRTWAKSVAPPGAATEANAKL
jgi:hypothetical protein